MEAKSTEQPRHPHIEQGVQDYYEDVFNFFSRRVSNIETAKELTQETFRKIINKADTYTEKKGNAKSWFMQIANNTLIDHYRSERHRQTESLDAAAEATGDEAPQVDRMQLYEALAVPQTDTTALGRIELERVRDAIDELPEAKRVTLLARLEDQPYEDIAAKTGANVNTAKTRFRQAMLKLRKRFER